MFYETHVQAYVIECGRVVHTEWLVVPTRDTSSCNSPCISYVSDMYQTSYLYRYATYAYTPKAGRSNRSQNNEWSAWIQHWWQQQPTYQQPDTCVVFMKHADDSPSLYDIQVSQHHPIKYGILSPSELNAWVACLKNILQSYLEVPIQGWPHQWGEAWLRTYHQRHRAYCSEQIRIQQLISPRASMVMQA